MNQLHFLCVSFSFTSRIAQGTAGLETIVATGHAKRILILSSEYKPIRGGIGTYAREIGVGAASLGAEVTLWAPDYQGRAVAEEIDSDMRVCRFRGGLHSFLDVPGKFRQAHIAARKQSFDIVHAVDWPFYLPVASLPRHLAPVRLATLHGTEINQMAQPIRKRILQSVGMIPRFDGFLCNSRFTRSLFQNHFAPSPDRGKITLLGVSPFWFEEAQDRETLRRNKNWLIDDLVVITVGRLTRRKGHLITAAALAKLPPQIRSRLRWLIVGPDSELDYVQELRGVLAEVPFRVELLGELADKDLRSLYHAADLFCLTGQAISDKVEGFGLVFLEAGAAGLPSIATQTGGVDDAVIDGQTGLLIKPGAVAEITSAIERILTNDTFRSSLSVNAHAYALKLSWQFCAAESYQLSVLR
jgi:glycosyltransferase involved in cell wall biosynthesis